MRTAIIHHPIYEKHDTGPGHPETSERYRVVIDALQNDKKLWDDLIEIMPEKAQQGVVQAAHTKEHFQRVENAFAAGHDRLDADTTISMKSFDASLFAAGGACRAVDAVMQWRYSPVMLNGTPVPFILTVVVSFSVPAGKTPGAAY